MGGFLARWALLEKSKPPRAFFRGEDEKGPGFEELTPDDPEYWLTLSKLGIDYPRLSQPI